MIHLRSIERQELESISGLEQTSSAHPWPLTSLMSSFDAGHNCFVIMNDAEPVGSMIVLEIIGKKSNEAELLNIVVFAPFQSQGFASQALEQLLSKLREDKIETLFLEVRQSNSVALKLYHALSFIQTGKRKDYYLNDNGSRETAILMQLSL